MSRLTGIIRGQDRSPASMPIRAALGVAAAAYRAAIGLRQAAFDLGLRRPARLGRPVLSVGNLTAGGTGKTPMVLELARRLRELGQRPAILLRGYRGGHGGSDEARLLAAELGPAVPIGTDPDRRRAAAAILRSQPAIDMFLLDDGFQHRQVARELDLVLVDATAPFGGGRLLPRGLLREPPGALRRAGAVVVTRADLVDPADLADLDRRIREHAGRPPLAHAMHRWTGWRDDAGQRHEPAAIAGRRLLAACGIANPAAFRLALARAAGGEPPLFEFADHHAYDAADLRRLFDEARACGAEALVTTEKDWVKWKPLLGAAAPIPVFRPILRIELLDGVEAFDRLLARFAGRPAG